ncbi:CHAT domain-containing protein [Sphingosinicella rhizophila]|uniref:CHAT domain-containing tetratricopeptide repeat protein n=1 Tax=Sphingosinicella rhizophila TaxID=3050082 RepID=A0ABU3QAD8_9SPHN|nr:CHAT domain-containing tetratricopeptide repeat protein [Sphingosinicella sp. GR2756]MDT9600371.1 CHAT domain-containing tetratricopeptide repeat protein [Sphingosinicella sp. GR2756]
MRLSLAFAFGFAAIGAMPIGAAEPIGMTDTFRIGSEGRSICTAQVTPADRALSDMFDRGYAILCRDAAVSVGNLYALRLRGGDPARRLAALRLERMSCEAGRPVDLSGLAVTRSDCRFKDQPVDYRVYSLERAGSLFVSEGFAGYDDALKLGLRTLVAGRVVEGPVSVATTGISDPAAFARALAANISPQRALAEAYRRNNSGNYAEAAEFFATFSGNPNDMVRPEALANEALQKSNLGSYDEAEKLFVAAERLVAGDPVVGRQLRNYRVMHLLNQGRVGEVYDELARPVGESTTVASLRQLVIDDMTARRLSSETADARRLGGGALSSQDRARILDAQALQLRGSALRLEGKQAEAIAAFEQALARLSVVRDGRVAATKWMQAQILAELADIAEANADGDTAERRHQEAIALLEMSYPGSSALLGAKGRLAQFHTRSGRPELALTTFRQIVRENPEGGVASPSLRTMLGSYFALLTGPDAPADAATELFRASQMLIRPGVAQTQAILARELGGGSDEASRLFRQSVNLAREVEQLRIEQARLRADGSPDQQRLGSVQAALKLAEEGQVATQSQLAQYPRYRALANDVIALEELQAALKPGEAYYKMVVAGKGAFALFITAQDAKAWSIGAGAEALERQVDALRATISAVEDGRVVTFPFDAERAHRLYRVLLDPVAGEMPGITNLIFEPDGALLRLPPNLLITNQASVDLYKARAARADDEGFDFTGVAWLGRDRDISTAVSPRAFRDLRRAAPSQARAQYIGFGQNKPADAAFVPAAHVAAADTCSWSLGAWGRPIPATELRTASHVLGVGADSVITGDAFTDDAIKQRGDLDQYRIIHFATHGMLSPPRPGCPSRPALMTSFGGAQSDGLLSFSEIFDLHLDADVVILSACDTAGRASGAANAEAGITSGGEFALDGLVRAFVGAGGRLVVASHWPVPDDFDATQRLIGGLFEAAPGTPTATALRAAQRKLMDDPRTSHPFYWAAFALVGDGSAPLVRPLIRTAARGR